MDTLHEELNVRQKKPYIESPDFRRDIMRVNDEFWANYLRTIPVSVILYVVNCNEPSDRLQESMLYLHSLCMEPIAKDMQVFIVFNVSFYSNKDENYIENPFKKS